MHSHSSATCWQYVRCRQLLLEVCVWRRLESSAMTSFGARLTVPSASSLYAKLVIWYWTHQDAAFHSSHMTDWCLKSLLLKPSVRRPGWFSYGVKQEGRPYVCFSGPKQIWWCLIICFLSVSLQADWIHPLFAVLELDWAVLIDQR